MRRREPDQSRLWKRALRMGDKARPNDLRAAFFIACGVCLGYRAAQRDARRKGKKR